MGQDLHGKGCALPHELEGNTLGTEKSWSLMTAQTSPALPAHLWHERETYVLLTYPSLLFRFPPGANLSFDGCKASAVKGCVLNQSEEGLTSVVSQPNKVAEDPLGQKPFRWYIKNPTAGPALEQYSPCERKENGHSPSVECQVGGERGTLGSPCDPTNLTYGNG